MKVKVKINLNDHVMVKLNDKGREIYLDHLVEINPFVNPPLPKEEDSQGFSTWVLWELMQIFGKHLNLGSPVPFDTGIIVWVEE